MNRANSHNQRRRHNKNDVKLSYNLVWYIDTRKKNLNFLRFSQVLPL